LLCARCGSAPVGEATIATVPLPASQLADVPDGPSFLRRLALGVITLLGLYQGLKHLALASAISHTGSTELPLEAQFGLLVAATLSASVAAGTVNRRAPLAGLLISAGAAAGFMGPDLAAGTSLPDTWLVGAPLLLILVGTVGGFAGRLIVPPAPRLPTFGRHDFSQATPVKKTARVIWWRVGMGVAVAMLGIAYADPIREALAKALSGHAASFGSSRLLTWQVSAVAALLGGVAAGVNTRSGLRQGIFAGILAGILAVFSQRVGGSIVEFWMDQLQMNEAGPLVTAALGGSTFFATAIGGWLGSQVCPPAAAPRKRHEMV
jgi:hypothetical protein